MTVLQDEWGGSVRELLNGGKNARTIYELLTATRDTSDGEGEKRKQKIFHGMGPKVARLMIARQVAAGICDPSGLSELGPPIDVHGLVLSFGAGVMVFDRYQIESSSTVVSALHAVWSEVCAEHELDIVALSQAMWLWGRQMCRPLRCNHCPLYNKDHDHQAPWPKHKRKPVCFGRISSGGYYEQKGPKRINPYVVEPQPILPFRDLPELQTPGIKVTNEDRQVLSIVLGKSGTTLALPGAFEP